MIEQKRILKFLEQPWRLFFRSRQYGRNDRTLLAKRRTQVLLIQCESTVYVILVLNEARNSW